VPVGLAELQVGPAKCLARRNDVQDGDAFDRRGRVEREPVRDARPAIVTADGKPLEAELPHQLDLVARHRPLRVRLVVGRRLRLRALAVAPQVGRDDREPFGQTRRDCVPHEVRLRVPVKQEERRPVASVAHAQRRLAGVDEGELEAGKQFRRDDGDSPSGWAA
jgi:hypothetical protein